MPVIKSFDSKYFIQPLTYKCAQNTHVLVGDNKPVRVILTQGEDENKKI